MKFEYTTIAHLLLETNEDQTSSRVLETWVNFEAHPMLHGIWRGPDGAPNKEGMKAMTQGLIHGLINQIHSAHQLGLWDSAEHLRYILQYLESGFVKQVTVEKTAWTTKKS